MPYNLKKDDLILVRNQSHREWMPRHFAYVKDGELFTYADGRTSYTTNIVSKWAFWKEYKREGD